MRIHYSSQSHEVLVFMPIRKGILHTWLRSHRVGQGASAVIDAASKHIDLGR